MCVFKYAGHARAYSNRQNLCVFEYAEFSDKSDCLMCVFKYAVHARAYSNTHRRFCVFEYADPVRIQIRKTPHTFKNLCLSCAIRVLKYAGSVPPKF